MTPEKPTSTQFLDPEGLRVWSLPDGGVVLKVGGERHVVGTMKRSLPLSEPERFIVLYDDDGQEIGTVRDINELEEGSQVVLRTALYRAYHIERITRILEVEREPLSGQTRWRVELAEDEAEAPADADANDSEAGEADESENVAPALSRLRPPPKSLAKPVIKRLLRRNTEEDEDSDTLPSRVKTREGEFFIAGQEDVSTARYPHIFIVDTERNRYEILNCEQLDPDSRRIAERYF